MTDWQTLIETLRREQCSCVIANGDSVTICRDRGVKDLYRILLDEPAKLRGARIADKVVGKGAAALMALGGVDGVYAGVISRPALALLAEASIETLHGTVADNIINRAGTGICPVEALCAPCATPAECLPLIGRFLADNGLVGR